MESKKVYFFFKWLIDIILSFIGIVILFPFFIIFSIIIKLESKGPIIFKQERIGKRGKVFKIYKFRSMVVGAEKTGSGVYSGKNDARVTKVGKFIRATSIDELPQLFNILKGEMSIIGPRPVLTYHPWKYKEYSEEQLKRFSVRPGITGLAQVNGRKELDWDTRIKFDIQYVDNISFLLDLKILLKTVINVILAKDNVNTSITTKKTNKKKEEITK